MDRPQLPLGALRAFEAAARHLSFTRAAIELRVSQGAVSHQVAQLERRLGTRLFLRLPRGLALTDEGQALVPVLVDAFDRISATLDRYGHGPLQEVLNLGVVGTFAHGWLLPRLDAFRRDHPHIDLRVTTNNNRVDLAGEGLDLAIRFGDGAWHGTHAEPLFEAPLTPLCSPAIASTLAEPDSLAHHILLRSYRLNEWQLWFARAQAPCPRLTGPVFDSSVLMVAAAMAGRGIALAPAAMFGDELDSGRLIRPFDTEVSVGSYWLTRLMSRRESDAMRAFAAWITPPRPSPSPETADNR